MALFLLTGSYTGECGEQHSFENAEASLSPLSNTLLDIIAVSVQSQLTIKFPKPLFLRTTHSIPRADFDLLTPPQIVNILKDVWEMLLTNPEFEIENFVPSREIKNLLFTSVIRQ